MSDTTDALGSIMTSADVDAAVSVIDNALHRLDPAFSREAITELFRLREVARAVIYGVTQSECCPDCGRWRLKLLNEEKQDPDDRWSISVGSSGRGT